MMAEWALEHLEGALPQAQSGERGRILSSRGEGGTWQGLGRRDGNLMGWDKEAADAAVCLCGSS